MTTGHPPPLCRICRLRGTHAMWCPELDIDDVFQRTASRYASIEEAFRGGYTFGLSHGRVRPTLVAIEKTIRTLNGVELGILWHRLGRPVEIPDQEITAQPSDPSHQEPVP